MDGSVSAAWHRQGPRPRPAGGHPIRALAAAGMVAAIAGCSSPAQSGPASAPRSHRPSAATAAAPHPEPHIMLIVDENDGYTLTLGSCGTRSPAPFMCSLASRYASAGSWYGVEHPSLPNYLDLVSGGDQGCTGDGCLGPYSAPSLGGQLTGAGIPWVAYMESMPSTCFTGATAGQYARNHDPFMDFADVAAASDCSRVVQPYPGEPMIAATLDATGAPDFVWITPNLIDDMHSSSVQAGDAWLQANLPPILASTWFGDGGTVIVTMDENDVEPSGACCGDAKGGQVPELVISRRSAGMGEVAIGGDHFGTLRSIEEAYGLPLLGAAKDARNGDLSSLLGG
jgi:hypothetical protein